MLHQLTAHSLGIFILCSLSMIILWINYLRKDRAAWVDVGWAFNFTLVILYLMIANISYTPSAVGLAFMYLFWSLRLSSHVLSRLTGYGEDPRYETLKASWGDSARQKFLGFFIFQGFLNLVFSLPLFIIWSDPSAEFSLLRKFAAILWAFASWAEGRADRQLDHFKRDPRNSGKTCNVGFWRFSRHPNYFFEFVIWVAYALFVLESPMGYLGLLCPALMLFFLFKVTGIPANEAQALRTRGKDYERYQKSTSQFFPWFPEENHGKKK